MLQTRSLYLYSLWRDSVSKHYISNSFFAVEGITLLKGIHFVWYVFVYPCLIWTKSKLIYNHWKALEECFLMPQTGILYLYLLRRNHILKCYMSISSFADAQINLLNTPGNCFAQYPVIWGSWLQLKVARQNIDQSIQMSSNNQLLEAILVNQMTI